MGCGERRTDYKNKFSSQSKKLSLIIWGHKFAVAIYARNNNFDFNWQPRFHDHIIRSSTPYSKISDYIVNNPTKWTSDKFYSNNKS